MKAWLQTGYGGAEQLRLDEVTVPGPGKGQVRVKVKAVSLNGSDLEFLRGSPGYVRMWGLSKPPTRILGSDVAGVVDAVGEGVSNLEIGTPVFGDILTTKGGLAEYVVAPAKQWQIKPAELSYIDAAALPQGGLVAMQGLRVYGTPQPGERVMINGAGGAAGSFAIQLARHHGARVTAVDRAEKLARLQELGADTVIDYQGDSSPWQPGAYDLILDLPGAAPISTCRRALTSKGRYVVVGGALNRILRVLCWGLLLRLGGRRLGMLAYSPSEAELQKLLQLHREGVLRPVVDHVYPLERADAAFEEALAGRTVGKIVLTC